MSVANATTRKAVVPNKLYILNSWPDRASGTFRAVVDPLSFDADDYVAVYEFKEIRQKVVSHQLR